MARLRRIWTWFVALALIFLAGEGSSRLDDFVFNDVPFLANPNRERDLVVHDELGVHGRPAGVFRKWKLNSLGFRGPEIDLTPKPGVHRVVILGASETFGLYESEGKEYPGQIRDELAKAGKDDFEVVNAAIAGISLKSMIPYWQKWVKRLQPKAVLIYPSPLFYLDDELPKVPSGDPKPSHAGVSSRFVERLVDTAKQNPMLRRGRVQYVMWRRLRTEGEGFVFKEPPPERLKAFRDDLEALVDDITAAGAKPILLTHARKSPNPPAAEDQSDLESMRVFFMRAQPTTMTAFEVAANDQIRGLGKTRGLAIIDADAMMSGERKWFADLVHFNDEGAGIMARLVADSLPPILAGGQQP